MINIYLVHPKGNIKHDFHDLLVPTNYKQSNILSLLICAIVSGLHVKWELRKASEMINRRGEGRTRGWKGGERGRGEGEEQGKGRKRRRK